ncbi:MAG: c-type cytochrome [Rhodoferax sp.]
MNPLVKIAVFLIFWAIALQVQGQVPGNGQKAGLVWNEMTGEKLQALQLKGDAGRGAEAFQACQGCHRHGAIGSPSGAYPRLAGQHASVLIEQITDIRSGRRINLKMAPFADEHVLTTQEIADVAAYLQDLPLQGQQGGQGAGTALGRGKELFGRDCAVCHGDAGQGNAQKFIPLVAGQHYGYLLREGALIRDEKRGNANPAMVKVIKSYRDEDLEAVSDYISRLSPP